MYPSLSKKHPCNTNAQAGKSKKSQMLINRNQTMILENRAFSSLCQLSANICREDVTCRQTNHMQQKQIDNFSPWRAKNQQAGEEEKHVKTRKKIKKCNQIITANQKCVTQNKQNDHFQRRHEDQMTKSNSIFFKIVGLRQRNGTLNLRSQHPDLEMVACLQKHKKYSLQLSRGRQHKQQNGEVQLPGQITPKILNLEPKMKKTSVNKKVQTTLVSNWSQELRQNQKDKYLFGEHWKCKSKNGNKQQVSRKLVMVRNLRQGEAARQIRQTCLMRRKGSLSLDRTKKDEYKSNNPLTRLLYEKYLHTIGTIQRQRDKMPLCL